MLALALQTSGPCAVLVAENRTWRTAPRRTWSCRRSGSTCRVVLTHVEMEQVREQPDVKTPTVVRDRAILETRVCVVTS